MKRRSEKGCQPTPFFLLYARAWLAFVEFLRIARIIVARSFLERGFLLFCDFIYSAPSARVKTLSGLPSKIFFSEVNIVMQVILYAGRFSFLRRTESESENFSF